MIQMLGKLLHKLCFFMSSDAVTMDSRGLLLIHSFYKHFALMIEIVVSYQNSVYDPGITAHIFPASF